MHQKLYLAFMGGGREISSYKNQNGVQLAKDQYFEISRINIFVGATNSGKSRLMRGIIKNADNHRILSLTSNLTPYQILDKCQDLTQKNFKFEVTIEKNKYSGNSNERIKDMPWLETQKTGEPESFTLTPKDFSQVRDYLNNILIGRDEKSNKLKNYAEKCRFVLSNKKTKTEDSNWLSLNEEGLTEFIRNDIEAVVNFIDALPQRPTEKLPGCIYIPTLRTVVSFPQGQKITSNKLDAFAESVISNYELDPNKVDVFTGNQLYQNIESTRSSPDVAAHNQLHTFEGFLGETLFEGVRVKLVASKNQENQHKNNKVDQLSLLIDDLVMRPFHDLGDGIQSIFILTYKLFTAPQNSWIFIEEPEQGLHPGLQRILLDTIANHPILKEKNLVVFMTTHSSHLLGMAVSEFSDTSVFAFQKLGVNKDEFEARLIYTPEHSLLNNLGVANSSVFLANCGVWVEGITDRKYLKAYLSAYLKYLKADDSNNQHTFEPQEDIHYAFFEYAGSNLIHYLFEMATNNISKPGEQINAQFLSNRIFLLADKDSGKEEKKHNYLKNIQTDNFKYYVTPGVEVENLLSPTVLKIVLPKLIKNFPQDLAENAITKLEDYEQIHLGTFLRNILGNKCPKGIQNGTLDPRYKNKLADLVCEVATWDNMSLPAREITKSLFEFIRQHNYIKRV